MNENFTRVPNILIRDSELNSKELLVATILLTNLNSKNITTFNLQSIYDILHIKGNNTRAKNEIKDILLNFKEMELFGYYNNIFLAEEVDIKEADKNNITYALFIEYIEGFTTVKDEEIYKIINYSKNNKIDASLLLHTLLYILSYINLNKEDIYYKLAYPSIINIADNIGIAEKSVLKYINILRDLNILVFDYAGIKVLRSGDIKNTNMYYARLEDENILLSRLKEERIKEGYIIQNKLNKDKSNLKRKIKQEINNLSKKATLNKIEDERLNELKREYKRLTIAPAKN